MRWVLLAFLSLFCCLVVLDHFGCFGYHGDDHPRFDRKTAKAIAVIDGITISLQFENGQKLTARLLGIDAPLSGLDCKNYTNELLNQPVLVRLEPLQTRDGEGHLLAYLYLNDSDVFNVKMVRDGYAYADRRVNHTLAAVTEMAESDARRHQRGLWGKKVAMPGWREAWLKGLREKHPATE